MMPLNVDTYKGKLNSIFSKIFNIFLRDNGEGSSKTPNNNESSSIGYEDYEWSSDESSGEEVKQPSGDGDCAPKSDMDIFKEVTNKASTEEVANIMNTLESTLEEYKHSAADIPAAKTQMESLEEKINICAEKISRDMEEAESKGKEPEGKGKEPEGK